ncbi:DUF6221 family protein [Streptomyces sediminimaris]|uniref:DUF6221 family protein n=1 Tax=Streptomyces sediminimaris TaxID=3383721 RepID=UPI00399A1626
MGIEIELSDFLRARWGEEEHDSMLFHEFTCPVPNLGAPTCSCPCPAKIRERIATQQRILARCEQRIRHEQEEGVCWPLESAIAFQTMKALALPFELHPAWQDSWYP